MPADDMPRNPLEKPGYTLEFNDDFDDPHLNLDRWIPYYLPHWSSRQQAAPRYTFAESALLLQIEADQRPWCAEFDGEVKCSSLQTGLYAGALGSVSGQHRFNQDCRVREEQTPQRTYTPRYGYFEARARAVAAPGSLCALWMIGFEEDPRESGEIAVFEVFGDHLTPGESEVRYGVHPWRDPALTDEFYRDTLPINAACFHIYAVEWTPSHIDFYVDNVKRRTINQSPPYPMQFMLGIYELPGGAGGEYPKQFTVDYVRGYQPVGGYQP